MGEKNRRRIENSSPVLVVTEEKEIVVGIIPDHVLFYQVLEYQSLRRMDSNFSALFVYIYEKKKTPRGLSSSLVFKFKEIA